MYWCTCVNASGNFARPRQMRKLYPKYVMTRLHCSCIFLIGMIIENICGLFQFCPMKFVFLHFLLLISSRGKVRPNENCFNSPLYFTSTENDLFDVDYGWLSTKIFRRGLFLNQKSLCDMKAFLLFKLTQQGEAKYCTWRHQVKEGLWSQVVKNYFQISDLYQWQLKICVLHLCPSKQRYSKPWM